MAAGVGAGHPATAEAGLRTLAAGGSAADAAAAAILASCVSESIFTGIGGGGFATYYDASSRSVTCLDFFCAVPGLDGDVRPAPMISIDVSYGNLPMDYMIGGASVCVPGVPAGTADVHRRWGRLPWREVVEPAIGLAKDGVAVPDRHARTLEEVAPALAVGDGAGIYAPGGALLQSGELLVHPGLDTALAALADEGADVFYRGWIGSQIVEAVREAGGTLGRGDLARYKVRKLPVANAPLAGLTVSGRRDLLQTIATLAALPPDLPEMGIGARAVAMAHALVSHGRQRRGETTNVSTMDAQGNACVITVSLGIGSGVWVPGLGVHLNSMLGEGELITPDLMPGRRMRSMMCPLVVVDADGQLVLAAGAAGASRIRTALTSTVVRAVVDGLPLAEAVAFPRFHAVRGPDPQTPPVVHAEPGYPEEELDALGAEGFTVNRWQDTNVYFGGVSAVDRIAAAGDPRRSGVGLVC